MHFCLKEEILSSLHRKNIKEESFFDSWPQKNRKRMPSFVDITEMEHYICGNALMSL